MHLPHENYVRFCRCYDCRTTTKNVMSLCVSGEEGKVLADVPPCAPGNNKISYRKCVGGKILRLKLENP